MRASRTETGAIGEVSVEITYGQRYRSTPRRVTFRAEGTSLSDHNDFLLPMTLLPAMLRGEPLELDGPISAQLLANLDQLQRLLVSFGPEFGQTPAPTEVVAAPSPSRSPKPGKGVACFFSGGVDSLYTVLRNRNEVTSLVFVYGFDVPLRNTRLRKMVSKSVHAAAEKLGLPLIEIDTDLKTFSDSTARWDLYHGGALAAVALLLAPQFRKVYIAGPDSLLRLYGNGTHPMLDPLWSTEEVEIVPDAEAERWEKILYLATSGFDCSDLRVCYENRGGALNCGRCDKCVMTMAMAKALGISGAFPSLPRELDLSLVERIDCGSLTNRLRVEDCILILREREAEPELMTALCNSMRSWTANLETRSGHIGAGHIERLRSGGVPD